MSVLHALVLGLVQGLTEFFPVSSSGHLALVPWLFGWDDFAGDQSLEKAFEVALHLGTLVGAVAYFARDLGRLFRGALRSITRRREPVSRDGRLAWLLALSAVPAAIVGFTLNDRIEDLSDEIGLIAVMLIGFGLVLYWADRATGERGEAAFGIRHAIGMGLGQALALQPGVSRSAVTISISRRMGFGRTAAVRLSFLMSLPVIAGAGLFKAYDVANEGGIPSSFWVPFGVGTVTSAVTGWLAVWATIRWVRTHSFTPFVIYRVGLGVLVLLLLATGAR